MAKTPDRRDSLLADLEWLVIPPLSLGQAKIYLSDQGAPMAYVSWALVSDEIDVRLCEGATSLKPEDWQSGPHVWVIELIAPDQDIQMVMEMLRKTVFAGNVISVMAMGGDRLEPPNYNN